MSEHIESSSSTENSDEDDIVDINPETIRYNQMKKKHEPKNNLKAYQAIDDEIKDNVNERMLEGINHLLCLHSPFELSSICGQLELPCQQKGPVSLNHILKFINSISPHENDNNEDKHVQALSNPGKNKQHKHRHYDTLQLRIKRVLYCMWEGAMFEYLRCIGHPTTTIFKDPRDTILRIWLDGGIIDNGKSFIPHFTVRYLPQRHTSELSPDIKDKIEPIKILQDKVKVAERRIIVDQDYSSILQYLKLMGQLRSMENNARDYFISEIEIGRARLSSCENTSQMYIEQLYECETQSSELVNYLNTKLAHLETTNQRISSNYLYLQAQIIRLQNIIDSYNLTEDDDKNKLNPLELYEIHESKSTNSTSVNSTDSRNNNKFFGNDITTPIKRNISIYTNQNIIILHKKLQDYYIKHHINNSTLSNQINEHTVINDNLKLSTTKLSNEIKKLNNLLNNEISKTKRLENKVINLNINHIIKYENKNNKYLYHIIFQMKSKILHYESLINSLESLLLYGSYHINPILSKFSKIIAKTLNILTHESYKEKNERYLMNKNDFPILMKGPVKKKKQEKKNNSPLTGKRPNPNQARTRMSPSPSTSVGSNDTKSSSKYTKSKFDKSDTITENSMKMKNKNDNFLPDIKNKILNVTNEDAVSVGSSNNSSKNDSMKKENKVSEGNKTIQAKNRMPPSVSKKY